MNLYCIKGLRIEPSSKHYLFMGNFLQQGDNIEGSLAEPNKISSREISIIKGTFNDQRLEFVAQYDNSRTIYRFNKEKVWIGEYETEDEVGIAMCEIKSFEKDMETWERWAIPIASTHIEM